MRHERCGYDEVFLGNIDAAKGLPEYLRGLGSAKVGYIAYDLSGRPLEREWLRPLFITRHDLAAYDKMMLDQLLKIKEHT